MPTLYEWAVEILDGPEDEADIIDRDEHDTLAGALAQMEDNTDDVYMRVSLRRLVGNEADGLVDEQRAELDCSLPAQFDGGATVPQRFHLEVARNGGAKL